MIRAPRRPAAFRPDEAELPPEPAIDEALPATVPTAPTRGGRIWLRLLGGAVGALLLLAAGLAVDSLVRALFARTEWLGWPALALAGLAALALLVLLIREIAGLMRLGRITALSEKARAAAQADDRDEARAVAAALIALYRHRPDTARGRAALASHAGDIIDGRDLMGLAEAELLLTIDEAARRAVLAAARRVSLVTAVSPRALVDIVFVAGSSLRLIREIGYLYGGRPGALGFLRLTRTVLGHLVLTGGIAVGDSFVQQILGQGLAARLSARLGEGVINGLMTARVGIAAIEVCRPLPFLAGRPPRLGDIMAEIARGDPSAREAPPTV